MGYLRAGWKLIALTVLSAPMYLFLVIAHLLLLPWRRFRGMHAADGRLRTRVFGLWARQVGALLGMQIEVEGQAPASPFFLVANHLSYVDVILLAGRLPCVFVARADVGGWPVVGALCRAADTLFIDRGSKRDIPRVMRQIRRVLDGGRGIVVFPEGTSTQGREVQRFKPSLLEAAAGAGLPVSYASLSYRTACGNAPAHRSVCWWGDMAFGRHFLRLLQLPGFVASLRFGDAPIQEADRKILAGRLHDAVQRQFKPVVQQERR